MAVKIDITRTQDSVIWSKEGSETIDEASEGKSLLG